MVLIASGDNENARSQLETSAQILESVRFEQRSPEARAALFDLQTKCYHRLQKTLVAMGRNEEALVAAERCKSRQIFDTHSSRKTLITCSESIFEIVNRSKNNVIYFSLAGDELFTWFLQPQKGIVRFNASAINESTLPMHAHDTKKPIANKDSSPSNHLEKFITMVRDSLGVNSDGAIHENDTWRSSENLLDDLANERAGFLQMVNRNHLLNSSNYSLSSLFSLGSVGGSVASLQGSTRYETFIDIFCATNKLQFEQFLDLTEVCKDQSDPVEYHPYQHGKDPVVCTHCTIFFWLRLMIFCQTAR